MEEASSAMEVDAGQIVKAADEPVQASEAPQPTPRPTPRKLPKFPIDLHMPLTVYWPESDDKIIVCFCEQLSFILVSSSHLRLK